MRTIKVRFYVSTNYVGAAAEEELELTVPIDSTDEQIDEIVREYYEQWMYEQLSCSYQIIN